MLAALEKCKSQAEYECAEFTDYMDRVAMAPIRNHETLKALVTDIIDTSELPPDADKDDGAYYLFLASAPLGHLVYTLKTMYLLCLAERTVYVEYRDSAEFDPHDIRTIFLTTLAEKLPNVHLISIASQELHHGKREAFIAAHPEIRHAVCMGDAPNMLFAVNRFQAQGLTVHRPGTVLVYVDYTDEDSFDADEKIHTFGALCADGQVDFDAYHGPDVESGEVYAGFDYNGLLWNFEDVAEHWERISVSCDKCVIMIFSDRDLSVLELPPCVFGNHFQLLRKNTCDFSLPLYNFDQLFFTDKHNKDA